MKFKNNRTGAVIDSPFNITGAEWEKVNATKKETDNIDPEKNLSKMTKNELIDYAEKKKIEISTNDTKAEIIEKLEG